MKSQNTQRSAERGSLIILGSVSLVVLMGFGALAVDMGNIFWTKSQLQNSAEAAAFVATKRLPDSGAAMSAAKLYAHENYPDGGNVLVDSDIIIGKYDWETGTFSPTGDASEMNAVRVTARRADANSNPLPLFLAPVLGHRKVDISASAVAALTSEAAEGADDPKPPAFRYLIDEEMIDSDIKSIENFAAANNEAPDFYLYDHDNDGFIDLPPGTELELETGQIGDEGLFDTQNYSDTWDFTASADYALLDFLAYDTSLESQLGTTNLENIEWSSETTPHQELVGKKVLDPVRSVDPMDSSATILDLPDAAKVYISPVFKSDVSMVSRSTSPYGAPAANLQGERRGLLAWRMLSARSDPRGGSYLPLVTIQVLEGTTLAVQVAAGVAAPEEDTDTPGIPTKLVGRD